MFFEATEVLEVSGSKLCQFGSALYTANIQDENDLLNFLMMKKNNITYWGT